MSESIIARRGGLDITKMQLIAVYTMATNEILSTANIPSDYDIALVSHSSTSKGQFIGIYDQAGSALSEQRFNVTGYNLETFFYTVATGEVPRGVISRNTTTGSTSTISSQIAFLRK